MTTAWAMNRREFAQVAALLLPLTVPCGTARAHVEARAPDALRFAFLDPRFPRALRYALGTAVEARWQVLATDVSTTWQQTLRPALSRGGFIATGITTSSVPFCLEILARERAVVRLTQQRIDRDLVHWTLEARPHG